MILIGLWNMIYDPDWFVALKIIIMRVLLSLLRDKMIISNTISRKHK